jgi:UDP-3-O-[3-hydroxymyristoyl] N-acetylglucosamine deacetylase
VADSASVTLRGVALHCGHTTEVSLSTHPGPLVLVQHGVRSRLRDLRVVRADRGVTVASEDGRVRVDLVEHLFAAVGGLGIIAGLRVDVVGTELPLLDGGARAYAEALVPFRLPRHRSLSIAREATLRHGDAEYRFAPAAAVRVAVAVRFPSPVGRQAASWDGDPDDFRERIAPARTFGWARDVAALRAAGRAASVDLASVLVFGDDAPLPGCAAPGHAEPARHKLLDLIGDLALYGGPPKGVVDASLPGHAATHAVMALALAAGVLVQQDAS